MTALTWAAALSFCGAAKADRLKQAKAEAEREIAAYKTEREEEFKRKVCALGQWLWCTCSAQALV
jgi:hypothetical protein